MTKFLTFLTAAWLCFSGIPVTSAHAADCYALSSGDVTSIDLNGKDMWFHLNDAAYASFLSSQQDAAQQCIVIGGNRYGIQHVQDGGISLLKMVRPDIESFGYVVAALTQP